MHPEIARQLADDRRRDLLALAARQRIAAPPRPRRRGAWRWLPRRRRDRG